MIIVTLQLVTQDEKLLNKLLGEYIESHFLGDLKSFVLMQTPTHLPPTEMVGYDIEGYEEE